MLTFICSLVFETSITHYYEGPWIDFFQQNIKLLIVETITVILLNYFLSEQVKLLYNIYCYIYLLRSVFILYRCQQYMAFNTALQTKFNQINRGFIGFTILLGFRNFIYRHILIDIISLLIGVVVCYKKRAIIRNAIKLIYSNLTTKMRQSFYIYLLVNVINIVITLYI